MKIILISIISILIILSSSIRIHKKGKISLISESHQDPIVIYNEERGEIKKGPAVENSEKKDEKKDEKKNRKDDKDEKKPKVEEETSN